MQPLKCLIARINSILMNTVKPFVFESSVTINTSMFVTVCTDRSLHESNVKMDLMEHKQNL